MHALLPDRGNGVTAIDKRPSPPAVRVSRYGLFGDVQADREHHGGDDQAVYAYAEEDAAHFARELGREMPPGLFGENLRTRGVDVTGAVIGERWRVGERRSSRPPTPAPRAAPSNGGWASPGWQDRFREHGASGAYFRVLRAASIRPAVPIAVVDRPAHGVTIGRLVPAAGPRRRGGPARRARRGRPRLRPNLRDHAERALRAARA